MKKTLLSFLFLSILALNSLAQEDQLQLTLKAAKETFQQGEEVNLKLILKNNGSRSVRIYTPDFAGVSQIVLKDTQGNVIEPKPYNGQRAWFQQLATIEPAASKEYVYFNMTWYDSSGAKTYQASEEKLPPGEYEVTVSIVNPAMGFPAEKKSENTWQGSLTSNSVKFRIK